MRKPYIRWSEEVGRRVCDGLAQGISLRRMGALPHMPSPQQVRAWMRANPAFARQVRDARAAGGIDRPGRHSRYDEATASAVFQRLARGEPLYRIARDPALPCLMTLYNWMNRDPRFARRLWVARDLHFDRLAYAARATIARLDEEEAAGEAGRNLRRSLGLAASFGARKDWR